MIRSVFFILLSLSAGRLSYWVWNHTPAGWLQESGAVPVGLKAHCFRASGRFTLVFSVPFFLLFLWPAQGLSSGFALPAAAVSFCLVQLSVCDIRYRILQDQWILFLAAAGLLFPVPAAARAAGLLIPLAAYALMLTLARAFGRDPGLGAGDAKLAAGLGFSFGGAAMLLIFCHAFLLAGVWALVLLLTKKAAKGDRIPFGPFAALSCFGYLLSTWAM